MTARSVLMILSLFPLSSSILKNGTLEDYSFLALIGTYTDEGWQLTSACTGCIITARFILTTTQCYRVEEKWAALVGSKDKEKFVAPIEKWILHPHYLITVDATHNDIALVILEERLDLGKNMIEPITIKTLPTEAIEYDLQCEMVGWKTMNPENLTVDPTSSNFLEQTVSLSTIYVLNKQFLSPMQCSSLINLISEVEITVEDSFMCVRHNNEFVEEPNYGLIGSPLLCKADIYDDEWILMGLKSKQRNIQNNAPELFTNIHSFETYISNKMKNPDSVPFKYFCGIQVCGKKYDIHGEYCLHGNDADCYNEELDITYYFPMGS